MPQLEYLLIGYGPLCFIFEDFLPLDCFLGWGGCVAIIFVNRFGRLPVLFWSQVVLVVASSCSHLMRNMTGFVLGIPSRSNFFAESQDVHRYVSRHDPGAVLLTARSLPLLNDILRVASSILFGRALFNFNITLP